MTPTTKTCTQCQKPQPATREYFHRRGRYDDTLDSWCKECRRKKTNAWGKTQRGKEVKRTYREERRFRVLQHYSGVIPHCACCSEETIEFLAIDHIDGGGHKHRADVGRGVRFYEWLTAQGLPEGYRVLCHNCNQSYGFYGYCPHQIEPEPEKPRPELPKMRVPDGRNHGGSHAA